MWKNAPLRGLRKREAVNPVDYFNPFGAEFNLFHQSSDHLPFGGPVRLFQATFQRLGKRLNLNDNELEILPTALFGRQGAELIVKVLQTLLGLTKPWFELGPINQTILVGIDQTADAAFDLLCQRL
jgi:hypothetical protein